MSRSVIWWAFLLGFPLAYLGGGWLEIAEEAPARVMGALDRAMSIKAAQRLAESKGVAASGWSSYVIVETHDDLLKYYENVHKPDLAPASSLAPARDITVLLRSPNKNDEFRAYLSLTGQVTGFAIGGIASRPGQIIVGIVTINSASTRAGSEAKPADKEAEQVARQYLAGNAALNGLIKLGEPKFSDDAGRTEVTWDATPESEEELTFHVAVAVRDGRVVGQRITTKLDEDYVKSKLPKSPRFAVALNVIYSIFLTFSVLYAIFRYAKRTFQKEVSHLRTLVVAALFCLSSSVYVYCVFVDQVVTRVDPGKFATLILPIYAGAVLSSFVLGLFVGIGYGSGEGEVREAYPGKLTSLDALLAGRLFSRDVATSVLFGVAAAGWLLLCQHALGYFLPTDMVGTRTEGLHYTFARLPWLSLLIGRQYESLLIAVAGLLLPAAFLQRSKSRGKRRYIWLLLFAVCAVMHDAASYPTAGASLLAIGILVGALLIPFFAFDLLAAMVSLSVLAFVNELARLSAVFPSWIHFALWLASVVAAALAVAGYLALRGKSVNEEDVRPLYAKNLAERMGLQVEVQAAREAQLRLMPQAAPQIAGLEFAACCLPAKGVGGDFYDFFPLEAKRVGIFVAQGGERGLASALCVALAKGVLMHSSQQAQSAAQIVAQLEASMAKLLQGESGTDISFVYAVIDSQRQLLNYARVGVSPRVLIHRRDSGLANAELVERRAEAPGRAVNARPILEGAAQLAPGDHLFFFTEGIAALRLKRFGNRPNQWLEVLMNELRRHPQAMQGLLASTLAKYQHRASEDLTAVVLRAEGVA